jgi:hypothetical protein
MNCFFQDCCLSTKTNRAWALLGDDKWLGIFLCDGCFDVMECSETAVTKELPTEQWIEQLYDEFVGDNNEKQLV